MCHVLRRQNCVQNNIIDVSGSIAAFSIAFFDAKTPSPKNLNCRQHSVYAQFRYAFKFLMTTSFG
jgi:hypothetical protein